eukprot:1158975-Pelagomonas_calceolata.AAC.4
MVHTSRAYKSRKQGRIRTGHTHRGCASEGSQLVLPGVTGCAAGARIRRDLSGRRLAVAAAPL